MSTQTTAFLGRSAKGVIVVLLIGFSVPSSATPYHVSLCGDDTNCNGQSADCYVSGTNQTCAKKTIQTAMNLATVDGDVVYVAPGEYRGGDAPSPNRNRDLEFPENASGVARAITVQCSMLDSPNACVIDVEGTASCPAGAASQHRPFNFFGNEAPNGSVVQGFTIRNGCIRYPQPLSKAYGGGILIWQARPTIRDCILENNRAELGGAIGIQGANNPDNDYFPIIENCTISNNHAMYTTTAALGGGGIYIDSHIDPIITNCRFSGNSAPYRGGGMYWGLGCDPRIDGCVVENNSTTGTSSTSGGGGLFFTGAKLTSTPEVDHPYIVRTRIGPNNSTLKGEGGGIKIDDVWSGNTGTITWYIQNSSIVENHADGVPVSANNCYGNSDFRGGVGGGISVSGCYTASDRKLRLDMANVVIAGNTATSGGGFHTRNYTPVLASNLTFMHNKTVSTSVAGSAIYYEGLETSSLSNAVLWYDSTSPAQNQVRVGASSSNKLTVQRSDVQDTLPATVVSNNIIQLDPLFVDPDGPDNVKTTIVGNNYRLQNESPCNDSASVLLVRPDDLNLDNNSSTTLYVPLDLDNHDRFVDDPPAPYNGVLDTTHGYTEYVDMGAFEYDPSSPTCPPAVITSSSPPSGTHDSRRPHPNLDCSISARVGLGDSPNPLPTDIILITLSNDGVPVSGATSTSCWSLCETGIEQVDTGCPVPSANSISSITETIPGEYQVQLSRPISGAHWTRLTYAYSGGSSCLTYACLPGDVNTSGATTPADIIEFVDCCLNHICIPDYGNYSCDLDHSGVVAPGDENVLVDLLNGASNFIVWNGKTLASNTCSCGGGMSPLSAGGEVSDEDVDNYYFGDWFVNYLANANPMSAYQEQEFLTVAGDLTAWITRNFDVDEQQYLVDQLNDPALKFASDSGNDAALDVESAIVDNLSSQ